MAAVEAQLQFYENALTTVELELLQDSLHDRFEHELLRERLPSSRWAEGEALVRELEREHRLLLMRRQRALEKLCATGRRTLWCRSRADSTFSIGSMDLFERISSGCVTRNRSGFSPSTQGARESNVLVKGLVRLVREIAKPNLWGQPSGEFLATGLSVLMLPLAMRRLRRAFGAPEARGLRAARLWAGPGGDLAALSGSRGLCGPDRSLATQPGGSGISHCDRSERSRFSCTTCSTG